MKRYLKSGYPNVQDIILEPGTYTFWAYIRSEFGDTYSFRLFNGTEWEVFDIDVEMGKWTKAFEVFTVKDKKTKLDPFARYFDSEQPVFLYKPQLIKGNIPSDAGASPFDIDSIVDDLHDNIEGIADFTNEEFADRVLSASERVSLKREMEAVESIFQSLRGSYEKLVINPYVPAIALSDLTLKYDSVMTAKTTLFNVLNLIIAGDDIVSPEEITAKDNALLTLNAALYSYNLAEKEITNALSEDYTQKISAIRDFTDDEFADRMLSETEKISLSHDLDNVQTVVDSGTSRFNELLLNPFITEADRDLLVEKYNALLDAWDWDEDLDSSKPNGLKTVILNIINDPDNFIDPDEMLEKDLALSAFNLALGEFSATEVYISKIIVEYAIDQATFWSIHATAPVIYKDSRNAITDGYHMPITVKGQLHRGTQIQDGGYITVTADEEVEAVEASFSPVLIEPLDHDGKSRYTIRLYDSKAKTMLLDTMTIPVVFRGANGKDAINITLSNEIDSVPASNAGTVSSYANTGTDIRVFEGATELTYDGVGTNLGTFKVTSLGINLTVGQISTPILGILKCVIGNIANLTADKGVTQFVVSGRTLEGEAFSEVKEQTVSKSKKGDTGADGDGITSTTIHYAKSSSGTTPPSDGWSTSLPSPTQGWYLWTRTTTTYKVAETTVSYSVSHWAEDGDGIVSTTIEYAKSSSGTTIPTTGWSTSIPSPTKGMYLWTRTTTEYKISPTTVAYTTSYWAEDGDGIVSTTIEYSKSSSGITTPTSGWSTNLPSPTLGWYLWTRTTTTYKKSSATVAYSISRWPADGGTGKGVSSVVIWYYKSSSATTQTGGSWSTTKPTYSASYYLWTKTITTYTDNSTTETTPIIDPDWHKVMAITDKFGVTQEGALIQAVMMLLREFNSLQDTAGLNGAQGALRNNPAIWAGGTYAKAYALIEFLSKMSAGVTPGTDEYSNLAKITFLHNGAAKIGDFIVEPSGRIVMVDPTTGIVRLVFGVEDIPTVASLLSGTVTTGSTPVGAGNTSSVTTLSGSTNVTKYGVNAKFDGTTISISAAGKAQASGMASFAVAELYAYRNGVKAKALATAVIQFPQTDNYQTDVMTVISPVLNTQLIDAGLYTFKLEVIKEGDISFATAECTASNFSWIHTLQGVRRQQYGLNGMMFFYSNNHFHFTEDGGLDLRGAMNIPGLLFSGSVNSGGGFTSWWGAKKHASLNAARQGAGTYAVYHSVGHSNYQVAITPSSNRTFYVGTKSSSYFIVYFYTNASSPSLSDTSFDFQITGNNYS